VLSGYRNIFEAAYKSVGEMAELYSSSNTEVASLTVESLERTAQEITREVEARRQLNVPPLIFIDEGQQNVIWSKYRALMLGKGEARDDSMIDGLVHACQMISDCARMASKPGAIKISKIEYMDAVVAQPSRRPINVFDAVKASARQARLVRNAKDGVALGGAYTKATPESWKRWKRERQELDLTQAIERTQLPHEMTIHERIMPYRVKED
jgi:hypothetical protein